MMNQAINIDKTALLVIDITNGCCHSKSERKNLRISFAKIRKMIPKLKKFIHTYRNAGGQIVFINCTPWKKEHIAKNLAELYNDPNCQYYSTDDSGFSEEFFELEPEDGDFIITKNSYDAFTNPKLNEFLKKRRIKHLIISGVFGDGCVHSTIQGGFSAGYNLIILKDLIETTDIEIRQNLQKLLKEYTWPILFGNTLTSEEFFDLIS